MLTVMINATLVLAKQEIHPTQLGRNPGLSPHTPALTRHLQIPTEAASTPPSHRGLKTKPSEERTNERFQKCFKNIAEMQETKTRKTLKLPNRRTPILQYLKVRMKRLMKCLKMNGKRNNHSIIQKAHGNKLLK